MSLPRGLRGEIEVNIRTDEYLIAPIAQGQEVGTVTLAADGEVLAERPLIALAAVEEAGFFGRFWDGIRLFFVRLFA